ncbi:D-alanyl-D-alanine carboxypeptidase [Desulfocapsa sulfexigens DSM 10523]|uniref:D-alanyl-D-alanine carboxypeptidase n=2 Tax=Desulfocapsa TaxID=53318 RepID=M1PPS1_DESSD|nr:D-alanyl-D-alanine carboxypeptidase [Desulfocapsa sulfexigens DSM 10523]
MLTLNRTSPYSTMHKILHSTPVFFVFCLLVLLFTSNAESRAELPLLNDTAKWQVATSVPEPAKQTEKIAQPSPRTEATVTKSTPISLGQVNNILHIKKRIAPPVTAATTKRLNKKISSRSAIIIDAVSGETLYSRNPDSQRQPASTIKVLTGMIAMKSLTMAEPVSVSQKAARQPRSKVYLDQKKKYQANDLINAVLLASANDASVALAEKIAGNEKDFAAMMTLRAKLWGAKNTICKTATGLTAKGQKSTARDLATIFRHAMNDPEFSTRMKQLKTRTTEGKLLRSHNKALWQVEGTLGGKTGYTNAARQTYVGKFKRGKDEIIVAIMGSETMWSDIKQLVTYGFQKKVAMTREREVMGGDIELIADLQRTSNKN